MTRLMKLCDKFNIQNQRIKINSKINTALEDLAEVAADANEKEGVLLSFLEKLMNDHEKNVSRDKRDVF